MHALGREDPFPLILGIWKNVDFWFSAISIRTLSIQLQQEVTTFIGQKSSFHKGVCSLDQNN